MDRKEVNCEYFLKYSKVCSAPTEMENPPADCIQCVHPKDLDKCLVKEYYDDPGPYVLEEPISLFEFIQRKRRMV